MSAGDGDWTPVFSGTANCRTTTGAGAGGIASSLDGSNCHGVSGDGGARSVVTLQAPIRTHPANAMHRDLAGSMEYPGDRRPPQRLLSWTDPVENVANVMVQQAVPRRAGREVITRTGQDRRFREAA